MTFGQVTQYFAGTGTYDDKCCKNRWGDYSATTLDPTAPGKFWTIQEYASSTPSNPNMWSTQFAQFSIDAGNKLSVVKNFAGSSQLGCVICIVPPDTMGAVGPSHFVQMGNGDAPGFAVYNKSDGKVVTGFPETLATFWNNTGIKDAMGNPGATNSTGDSRILYDSASERWFATTLANPTNSDLLFVGVSDTKDRTLTWKGFSLTIPADTTADFDTLGIDKNGLFVSARDLKTGSNTIAAIDKNALISPGILAFSIFPNAKTGVDTQPVVDLTNSDLPEALLSASTGSLTRSNITGTITSPELDPTPTDIPATTRSAPTAAAQPAMAPTISPDNPSKLPGFSSNVVLINNSVTSNNELWAVRTVLDPTTGNDDINWLRINPTDNTVIKEGVIGDPKFSFYFPSIAVNSSGQVVIGFSGSAAGDPEDLNVFQKITLPVTTSFTLVLAGNQTTAISLLATANDPLLNAFAYVNQNVRWRWHRRCHRDIER